MENCLLELVFFFVLYECKGYVFIYKVEFWFFEFCINGKENWLKKLVVWEIGG